MPDKCLIVLTVGNAAQAELDKALLNGIALPDNAELILQPDDKFGHRIGSGGAVADIVAGYYKNHSRILIINSGGMSSRAPNFSLRGKAFINIKYDGVCVSVIEMIIQKLMPVLEKAGQGVFVACNDIIADIDIDKSDCGGNIGFFAYDTLEVASEHGVMLTDSDGCLLDFLHKADREALKKHFKQGFPVDTGLVYLCDEYCKSIIKMCDETDFLSLLRQSEAVSLYADMICLMEKSNTDEYKGSRIKDILKTYLGSSVMKCIGVKDRLIHFGTLPEIADNIFSNLPDDSACILGSSVSDNSKVGKRTVIDNSVITGSSVIGDGCIITDVILDDVTIGSSMSVCGIRLKNGLYVTTVCDIKADLGDIFYRELFVPASSYTESYNKYFAQGTPTARVSIDYCLDNADYMQNASLAAFIPNSSEYGFSQEYNKYKAEIISAYRSKHKQFSSLAFKKDKSEISLPVRINFSGTWTDAMPYSVFNDGRVINAAVKIDGRLPLYVKAEKADNNKIIFESDDKCIEISKDQIDDKCDYFDFNLHKAALSVFGIDKDTVLGHGLRLTTRVKGIAKNSGLGTSSILLAGCFKALDELFGTELSADDISLMVFVAEQVMGTGGGWQDQVGGLSYGIKDTRCVPGLLPELKTDLIEISAEMKAFINTNCCLVNTGSGHFGRFVVSDIMNNYLKDKNTRFFEELYHTNDRLQSALINADKAAFTDCINLQRQDEKQLSKLVCNDNVEAAIKAVSPFCSGCCICGAGCGGYLFVILKEGVTVEKLSAILKNSYDIKQIGLYYP